LGKEVLGRVKKIGMIFLAAGGSSASDTAKTIAIWLPIPVQSKISSDLRGFLKEGSHAIRTRVL